MGKIELFHNILFAPVYTHYVLVFPQEQDTLGDAEERCTQLMHQKVQLEESLQVMCWIHSISYMYSPLLYSAVENHLGLYDIVL